MIEWTIGTPQLSGKWVAGLIFVVLSMALEYVPQFREKWEAVKAKELVIAGAGMVVVWALVGLHYLGAFGLEIGQFGWPVVGEILSTWMAFLGGDWAIWNTVKDSLPRNRKEQA